MRTWVGLAAILLLASCARGSEEQLTVFAAASLAEAFTEIADRFEETHPEVTVTLSLGPSSGLATQIGEGAPADVFASADERWIDRVEEQPGILNRTVFAGNRLVVITPRSGGVSSLQDLAAPGIDVVLAAPGVPAGDYARRALSEAGISGAAQANVVSNEQDVKGVVQKVLLGEADAGIVYRTDLTEQVVPRLGVVEIPAALNVTVRYSIAVVAVTSDRELAARFVAYVLEEGQGVLRSFGFLPPP
ncbi:MAG: molybdate ABC transporter substrate-binding protein [Acidimicrobiia bacterium]